MSEDVGQVIGAHASESSRGPKSRKIPGTQGERLRLPKTLLRWWNSGVDATQTISPPERSITFKGRNNLKAPSFTSLFHAMNLHVNIY